MSPETTVGVIGAREGTCSGDILMMMMMMMMMMIMMTCSGGFSK